MELFAVRLFLKVKPQLNFYFNLKVIKQIAGYYCTADNQCQDYLSPALYCGAQSVCVCPTGYYWGSTSCCKNYKNFSLF